MGGRAQSGEVEAFVAEERRALADTSLPTLPSSISSLAPKQHSIHSPSHGSSERQSNGCTCSAEVQCVIERARALKSAIMQSTQHRTAVSLLRAHQRHCGYPDSSTTAQSPLDPAVLRSSLAQPPTQYAQPSTAATTRATNEPAVPITETIPEDEDEDEDEDDTAFEAADDAVLDALFNAHNDDSDTSDQFQIVPQQQHSGKTDATSSDEVSAHPTAYSDEYEASRIARDSERAGQAQDDARKDQSVTAPAQRAKCVLSNKYQGQNKRTKRISKRSKRQEDTPTIGITIEVSGIEIADLTEPSGILLVFKGMFGSGQDLQLDLSNVKLPFHEHLKVPISELFRGVPSANRSPKVVVELWLRTSFIGIATTELSQNATALKRFAHDLPRSKSNRKLAGGALHVRNPLSGQYAGMLTCLMLASEASSADQNMHDRENGTLDDEKWNETDGDEATAADGSVCAARQIQRFVRGYLARKHRCGADVRKKGNKFLHSQRRHLTSTSANKQMSNSSLDARTHREPNQRACNVTLEVTVMHADDLPPAHVNGLAAESVGCYVRYKWPLEPEPFYTHIVPREGQPEFAATAEHSFHLDGEEHLYTLGLHADKNQQHNGRPLLAFHIFDTSLDTTSASADILTAHGSLSMADVLPKCTAAEAGLENFTTEQELSVPLRSPAVGPAGGSLALRIRCTCEQQQEHTAASNVHHEHNTNHSNHLADWRDDVANAVWSKQKQAQRHEEQTLTLEETEADESTKVQPQTGHVHESPQSHQILDNSPAVSQLLDLLNDEELQADEEVMEEQRSVTLEHDAPKHNNETSLASKNDTIDAEVQTDASGHARSSAPNVIGEFNARCNAPDSHAYSARRRCTEVVSEDTLTRERDQLWTSLKELDEILPR